MCSSIGRCLLTRRSHIIHVCPRSDCSRGKLLRNLSSCSFGTLSVPSRKSCANMIIILAIVTNCFSTSHDLITAGISFPAPSSKAPFVKSRREAATRQSGIIVFIAVNQEERNVDHMTAHSNVALANQTRTR